MSAGLEPSPAKHQLNKQNKQKNKHELTDGILKMANMLGGARSRPEPTNNTPPSEGTGETNAEEHRKRLKANILTTSLYSG